MGFLYVPELVVLTANPGKCNNCHHEQIQLGAVHFETRAANLVRGSTHESDGDSSASRSEIEASANGHAEIRDSLAPRYTKEPMGREQRGVEGGQSRLRRYAQTANSQGRTTEEMRALRHHQSKKVRMGKHERPVQRSSGLQTPVQKLPFETRWCNPEHNKKVECSDCRCARVSPASNWESGSSVPPIERSAMWRGSSMRLRSWRLAWKRGILTPLLSTLRSSPSTRESGVDAWISSRRASRVSRSRLPESERLRKTNGMSGRRFNGSLASASQLSFSWRTSRYERLWSRGETFEDWASTCRVPTRAVPPSWVRDLLGSVSSFLARPTIKGDYNRVGSSERSGDGIATQLGGRVNPEYKDWLLGLPMGWSAIEPLETRLFRLWRRKHSGI